MDYIRAIILMLIAFSATAQPLTESELGWRSGVRAFGGLTAYIIPKNSALTNNFQGSADRGGVIFSIADAPANGAVTHFDPKTGTNVYTPSTDYVGVDSITYSVGVNGRSGASALGYVHISVADTNTDCWTNCAEYCCLPIYFSGQGPCNAPGVILFRSMIDASKSYTLTISDKNGQVSGMFEHTGGDPDDVWTPSPYEEDNIDLRFCGTLNSQPFFPVGNPICVSLCSGASDCMGIPSVFSGIVISTNYLRVPSDPCGLYSPSQSSGSVMLTNITFGVTNNAHTGGNLFASQDFSFGFCNIANTNKRVTINGLVNWSVFSQATMVVSLYTNGVSCLPATNGFAYQTTLSDPSPQASNSIPVSFSFPLIDHHLYLATNLVVECSVIGPGLDAFPRKFWGNLTLSLSP